MQFVHTSAVLVRDMVRTPQAHHQRMKANGKGLNRKFQGKATAIGIPLITASAYFLLCYSRFCNYSPVEPLLQNTNLEASPLLRARQQVVLESLSPAEDLSSATQPAAVLW